VHAGLSAPRYRHVTIYIEEVIEVHAGRAGDAVEGREAHSVWRLLLPVLNLHGQALISTSTGTPDAFVSSASAAAAPPDEIGRDHARARQTRRLVGERRHRLEAACREQRVVAVERKLAQDVRRCPHDERMRTGDHWTTPAMRMTSRAPGIRRPIDD
jgi:hypothetical protein